MCMHACVKEIFEFRSWGITHFNTVSCHWLYVTAWEGFKSMEHFWLFLGMELLIIFTVKETRVLTLYMKAKLYVNKRKQVVRPVLADFITCNAVHQSFLHLLSAHLPAYPVLPATCPAYLLFLLLYYFCEVSNFGSFPDLCWSFSVS